MPEDRRENESGSERQHECAPVAVAVLRAACDAPRDHEQRSRGQHQECARKGRGHPDRDEYCEAEYEFSASTSESRRRSSG